MVVIEYLQCIRYKSTRWPQKKKNQKKISLSSHNQVSSFFVCGAHFFKARRFHITVIKSQIFQTIIQSCFHIFRPMPRLSSAEYVSFPFQFYNLYVVEVLNLLFTKERHQIFKWDFFLIPPNKKEKLHTHAQNK